MTSIRQLLMAQCIMANYRLILKGDFMKTSEEIMTILWKERDLIESLLKTAKEQKMNRRELNVRYMEIQNILMLLN